MWLSVIIPGYNTPNEYWGRCLKSVLAALPEDGEVICVDDGSGHRPSVSANDPRIRWIYLEKNQGQATARNRALEVAQGEYVTFVDSDDEVLPDIYRNARQRIEETGCDIVAFGIRTVWPKERLFRESTLDEEWEPGELSVERMKKIVSLRLFDEPVNKIYRRTFLRENRILFPDGICPGEDAMFVLSCVMKGARWTTIRDVGYIYYRMDGTTLSRYLGNYENTLRYWKEKWDEYLETVGKGYDGWWPTKDYSEKWVAAMQWENMWRRGSPIPLREKWNYLGKHSELARAGRLLTLGIKLVKTFVRLHFYFRPIQRWHLKRHLPGIKDVRKPR